MLNQQRGRLDADVLAPDVEEMVSPQQAEDAGGWVARIGRAQRHLGRHFVLVLLIVFVAGLCAFSPTFRSIGNIENIFDQDVTLALVGTGMLFMMLTGGFDLSVGAAGAVAAVVAAAVSIHVSIFVGVIAGLGAALGVGLTNGLCIALANVNPFVTTLGTMTLWYGVLDVFTGGTPVSGTPNGWTTWGLGNTGPIANPVFIALGVLIVAYVVLRFTVHGGHVYAVGSNMAAAGRAGVSVRSVLCSVYVIGSLLAGVAGVVTVSESGVGDPTTGTTWALTSIAAIVIGGARLSGGVGDISAVIVGTLLLTVITNAFTIYNLSPFWVPVVTGLIVIIAVAASSNVNRTRGSLIKSRQI